jgi:hypothetical protein
MPIEPYGKKFERLQRFGPQAAITLAVNLAATEVQPAKWTNSRLDSFATSFAPTPRSNAATHLPPLLKVRHPSDQVAFLFESGPAAPILSA